MVGPNTTAFLSRLRAGRRRSIGVSAPPGRRAAAVRRAGAGAARRPAARRGGVGRRGRRGSRRPRRRAADPAARCVVVPGDRGRAARDARPAGARRSRAAGGRAGARRGGAAGGQRAPPAPAGERGGRLRAQAPRPRAAPAACAGARARRASSWPRSRSAAAMPTRPTSPTSAARSPACRLAVFCKTAPPERASMPGHEAKAGMGDRVRAGRGGRDRLLRGELRAGAQVPRAGRELRRARHGRDQALVRHRASWPSSNFEGGFERPSAEQPFNIELALVFEDVEAAFAQAPWSTGPSALTEPQRTPWGQTVAYVRDPFGTLMELATPVDDESRREL